LKKTQPWEWMKECQEAFEFLKKKFTEFPVLVIPDQLKLMLLNLLLVLCYLKMILMAIVILAHSSHNL